MRIARLPAISVLAIALAACGADQGTTNASAADPAPASAAAPEAADPANDATAPDAGTADPARFELDMARVDRWLDATRRLSALTRQDESLEEVVSADANEPRETYIARLQGNPAVADAIDDAGMSPTEYALTTETLIGALFALGMLDAGAIQELPPSIRDTQPVAFVQANKAEITAKMEALKRGDASAE